MRPCGTVELAAGTKDEALRKVAARVILRARSKGLWLECDCWSKGGVRAFFSVPRQDTGTLLLAPLAQAAASARPVVRLPSPAPRGKRKVRPGSASETGGRGTLRGSIRQRGSGSGFRGGLAIGRRGRRRPPVRLAHAALQADCQSALKFDPLSACNIDPPEWHGGGCPGSQQGGPARLRVASCATRSEAARGVPVGPPGQPGRVDGRCRIRIGS